MRIHKKTYVAHCTFMILLISYFVNFDLSGFYLALSCKYLLIKQLTDLNITALRLKVHYTNDCSCHFVESTEICSCDLPILERLDSEISMISFFHCLIYSIVSQFESTAVFLSMMQKIYLNVYN